MTITVLPVSIKVRPVLGPNEYAMVEELARILSATGLAPRLLLRVIGTLTHFVRGAAGTVAESRLAPTVTGVSDEDWWATRSALMAEVAPDFARRFPTIVALGAADTFDPGDRPYLEAQARETFRVGLAVILDGVESALPR